MSAISTLNFETGIAGLPERQASLWGFRSGDRGTHTSRTIMLDELSQLLVAVPGEARRQDYAEAVTHDNCLGKRTAATRQLSLQRHSSETVTPAPTSSRCNSEPWTTTVPAPTWGCRH